MLLDKQTPKHEKDFLVNLFSILDDNKIPYAVMRNYTALPYSIGGSDLDIYINQGCRAGAEKALKDAIIHCNAYSLGKLSTPTFYEEYIIGFSRVHWWGVCVEFYYGVFFKGSINLVDENQLANEIVRYNEINVLEEDIGNALGFIKEILVHDSFRGDKPQYEESINRVLKADSARFQRVFSPLGVGASPLLKEVIDSNGQPCRKDKIRRFRRYVVFRKDISSLLCMLWKRGLHELSRVKRIFKPSGTVIAILGVDGSGKSTLIDAISRPLLPATHNALFHRHLRPGLLPPLARLKGKSQAVDGPVINPHGSSLSGVPGSFFRLIYLLGDYVLGYWLTIRPLIAKRPAIIIYDRYAYDMALDQKRFRINLPPALVRFFTRLAPKPDLIFCLYGSPEVLAARKQELPLAEVSRQVNALKAFAATEPRAILVNTEQSIEACRDEILQAIVAYCDRRARQ